jgi:RHS repeat-associated protein
MQSLAVAPPASKVKLEFAYDYMGRRIQKLVSTNNGGGYVASYTNIFLYDGWNLTVVLDGGSNRIFTYTWGTDLSGSMQGAGGVGGLIAMKDWRSSPRTYLYTFDGNGNPSKLINSEDGSVAAEYEYDPFGREIKSIGLLVKVNPFRFSTKYTDDETDLVYYGYRYYNPSTGRWLSKDPIEEQGGLNLYGFVINNPINKFDRLGLHLAGELPAEIGLEIEAGVSLEQIVADFADWGLTLARAKQIATAIVTAAAVEEIIKNVQRNAKGKDPFEKAKNALRQVQRGIQNTLNTIKDHEGYINNPSSYPGGLVPPFDQHPEYAVDKWLKQLANQRTNLERLNAATNF